MMSDIINVTQVMGLKAVYAAPAEIQKRLFNAVNCCSYLARMLRGSVIRRGIFGWCWMSIAAAAVRLGWEESSGRRAALPWYFADGVSFWRRRPVCFSNQ